MHTLLQTIGTFIVIMLLAVPVQSQNVIYRGMNLSTSITTSDIDDLDTILNPNLVRYPINFGLEADTMTVTEYMARLNTVLDNLDAVILPAFAAKNIKVVLAVGSPPGGFVSHSPPRPQMRVFSEVEYQTALQDVWRLLAPRYKDNTTIVAFQLLSEPATGSALGTGVLSWLQQQAELVRIIREVDTSHPIVLTTAYSNPRTLKNVKLASTSGPFWYAAHVYYPVKLFQQGIDTPALSANYPSRRIGTRSTLIDYLRPTFTFHRKLLRAGGRDKIFISEFTATRFGPPKSDLRYLRDIGNIFNQRSWYWTYHAWREADVWSVEQPSPDEVAGQTTRRARRLQTYFAQVNGS